MLDSSQQRPAYQILLDTFFDVFCDNNSGYVLVFVFLFDVSDYGYDIVGGAVPPEALLAWVQIIRFLYV